MSMGLPSITGFGHIDLTVTDAERSARWWEEVMGFTLVNAQDGPNGRYRSLMHSCGVAVIMRTPPVLVADRFDDRVVGLDHLAFNVADRAQLEAWARHLDDCGVVHSGVQEENGGPLIVFRDPDNIQLEVYAFDMSLVTLNVEPGGGSAT
jgi:catechol 2,3-dioxygenase-like lactoylglutathione lyase family enzyme